jgi:hypothetical protein
LFLLGRVGLSWVVAYRAHYTNGGEEEAQRWLGDLIKVTLDFSLSLWHRGNGIIHGMDNSEAQTCFFLSVDSGRVVFWTTA